MSRKHDEVPAHAAQILTKRAPYSEHRSKILRKKPLESLSCVLDLDRAPTMDYFKRSQRERSCSHWGQLKLLQQEIAILTRCPDARTVVYAGAAPGDHLGVLSGMFPQMRFIAYDPASFSKKARGENVEIHQEFFTEKVAESFRGQRVVFICDIRTCKPPGAGDDAEIEKDVAADMARQREWVLQMRPRASILKFRLPWSEGATEYLQGDIWIQAWPPLTTTECRLVVREENLDGSKSYDNRAYERAMMFHNTIARCQQYDSEQAPEIGLCGCFDCALTMKTLRDYLEVCPAANATPMELLRRIMRALGLRKLSGGSKTSQHTKFRPRDYRGDKFQVL